MSVERLTADLAIISQLSDYPGIQDGLSTAEFKAKFDEAVLTIQSYINDVLVPGINSLDPNGGELVSYLPVSGGKMLGQINMNNKRITNLPTPSADRDAVPRSYVLPKSGGTMDGPIYMDNNRISDIGAPISPGDAAPKSYVDERSLLKSGGTMTGAINMGGEKITSLATPTNSADAANKGYVDAVKTTAEAALPKAGGAMTGTLDMGYHYITKLSANPQNPHDAVRKDYVDNAVAGAKSYADGKRLSGSVTLTASGWSNGVQDVQDETVSGILATDMPHWGVVYSSGASTREAEKEAFALVDVLETSAGKFTFRCFGDVPAVALNIQWEVNR